MLVALFALFIHPSFSHIKPADTAPALLVTVCDVQGNGLAGLHIALRADDDARLLAQSTTDAQGQALFTALPHTAIRIIVSGQLSNGSVLRQRGSDSQGVWYTPGAGHNALSFIIRADGVVELNLDGLIEAEQGSGIGDQGSGDAQTGRQSDAETSRLADQEIRRQADQSQAAAEPIVVPPLLGVSRQVQSGKRAIMMIGLCISITSLVIVLRRRQS